MDKEKFIASFRCRTYLHFDSPLQSKDLAWNFVQSFKSGSSHGFLPFLGYQKTIFKISRTKQKNTSHKNQLVVRKTKKREIKIASHRDTAIYSYYAYQLAPLYEQTLKTKGLTENVTAFRSSGSGKCNIHHAKDVFDFISANKPCVALAFDITSFFDHLDHKILLKKWASLFGTKQLPHDHYRVYKSLTRFSWVSLDSAYKTFGINPLNPKPKLPNYRRTRICSGKEFRESIKAKGLIRKNPFKHKGIPQGSSISALLSNIYMLDFDKEIEDFCKSHGGIYRRYCDDIMLVIPQKCEREARLKVYLKIRSLKLKSNKKKTDIVHFNTDSSSSYLQYLGFRFNGNKVLLRQGSLDRYYGKMRRAARLATKSQGKQRRRDQLHAEIKIRKLHLKYSHLVSSQRTGRRQRAQLQKRPFSRQNFISYANRSARIFESKSIKKQIRNHWLNLHKEIKKHKYLPSHPIPLRWKDI